MRGWFSSSGRAFVHDQGLHRQGHCRAWLAINGTSQRVCSGGLLLGELDCGYQTGHHLDVGCEAGTVTSLDVWAQPAPHHAVRPVLDRGLDTVSQGLDTVWHTLHADPWNPPDTTPRSKRCSSNTLMLPRWAAAALKRNLAVCGEEEGGALCSVFARAAQLLADLLPGQAADFAQGVCATEVGLRLCQPQSSVSYACACVCAAGLFTTVTPAAQLLAGTCSRLRLWVLLRVSGFRPLIYGPLSEACVCSVAWGASHPCFTLFDAAQPRP